MFARCYVAAAAALLTLSSSVESASHATPPAAGAGSPSGCLVSGDGYLRARIRGALDLDIDWANGVLECDGGPRPDGSGIRLSFAGPQLSDGRRLRMVFGVASASEGVPGRALPTNLTVIFEGEKRLFATRGEDKCMVDELSQERVGNLAGSPRTYRVVARGFCIAPANALDGDERILVSSFDFAGHVRYEDEPAVEHITWIPYWKKSPTALFRTAASIRRQKA